MPHTWSRLHEHLGCAPGPVDFAMIHACVDDELAEADDLDWKADLPNTRDPNAVAEFAKDVAAMANTRGGLIIYGVTDQVTFKGITETDANLEQYAQWVRNHVQPYLAGLGLYCLTSDDGRKTVLVVDVPASELAPHCIDFDPKNDRARSQHATVTPYRDGPHTAWMAEHQIARAYADRLTQAAQWQESFNELRRWTIESLHGRSVLGEGWLVVVARPTRLIPRTAPRLDGETAQQIVIDACAASVSVPTLEPQGHVLKLLGQGLGRVTVGLNAWVVANRRTGPAGPRYVAVELHHDGSLVFVANLATSADDQFRRSGAVDVDIVEQACLDLEALLLRSMRAERIDSSVRVQASVVSDKGHPLVWARRTARGYTYADIGRGLHRLRSITVELPAGATEDHARAAVAELAAGILNQFGIDCDLEGYATSQGRFVRTQE